ncbi:MAG TPA: HAMP domain-containing sensor histidine kinase [Planctomycetota bacterium]|nr:HAMP domain-containing sensor histidine kinase [Planctomycetota bacterium]
MPDRYDAKPAGAADSLLQASFLLFIDPEGMIHSWSGRSGIVSESTNLAGRHWCSLFDGWQKTVVSTRPGTEEYLFARGNSCGAVKVTLRNATGANGDGCGKFLLIEQPCGDGDLKSLEEIERAVALGRMTAQFAHELNNTLTMILGYVQIFMQDLPSDDPRHKTFEAVCGETLRTARMARGFLAMARGRDIDPESGEADINALLNDILLLLKPRLAMLQIGLKTNLAHVQPVPGSANELKQVFLNLLLNAISAIGTQGCITICTTAGSGWVQVKIADTGHGIDGEHIEKIFDAYYTTRPGGTGLGLYVSREIIRRHRGKLLVESIPGNGATFTVVLPQPGAAA